MRNMSFALTTDQVAAGTKDVTRRMGWRNLKQGEAFRPVKKCMGLKQGEKIQPIRGPVRAVSVRREVLGRMIDDPDYGKQECIREGFPNMSPREFVQMFCETHKGCEPGSVITRIEFEYTDQL